MSAPLVWTLRWANGDCTLQALGGMLAPVTFRFADGATLSPFQVAPWGVDDDPQWPGVLRRLRGEWPCLPYGASRAPAGLPAGWVGRDAEDAWDHGYTANHDWHCLSQTDTALTVGIDYPADSDVARLVRTVRPDPDAPALEIELQIHARRACRVPLALHPTFTVPATGLEILAADARQVHTYPVPTEPGVSRQRPNAHAADLSAVPAMDGGTLDLRRLPLPFDTEELLQLEACRSPIALHYLAERATVRLAWDTAVLPDALLWFSNRGRRHAPWSGRHLALGVEPMSGFFDLGRVVTPDAAHPLAGEQGVALDPVRPLVVRYRLSATQDTG